MNVDIPRGADVNEIIGSPAWWPHNNTAETGMVMIRCNCGALLSIDVMNKWRIDDRGFVRESVLHTRGGVPGSPGSDCGWHVFARLLDWPFGAMGQVE